MTPAERAAMAQEVLGLVAAGEEPKPEPATKEQIELARLLYQDDDIEIDDPTVVSRNEEGVWVQAWVWVSNSALEDHAAETAAAIAEDVHQTRGTNEPRTEENGRRDDDNKNPEQNAVA